MASAYATSHPQLGGFGPPAGGGSPDPREPGGKKPGRAHEAKEDLDQLESGWGSQV